MLSIEFIACLCTLIFGLSHGTATGARNACECATCRDGRDGRDGHDCGCLEVMELQLGQESNATRYEEIQHQLKVLQEELRQLKSCNQQGKVMNSSGGCSYPKAHPGLETKWVTFNGKTMQIYGRYGVTGVYRHHSQGYIVIWSHPFGDSNYAITGSANMQGTGGVMFDLEGNNIKGNAYKGVNPESCVVGIRNPRDNGGYDSDYITVVATGNAP